MTRSSYRKSSQNVKCSVDGCTKAKYARGFCRRHYRQMNLFGEIRRDCHSPNEFVDCGSYSKMKVYDRKQNHIADVLVDTEDVEKIKHNKWGLSGGEHKYVRTTINKKTYPLHRVILGLPPFSENNVMVDHINWNVLDNRKSNLRTCNWSENRCNSRKNSNNKTGYRGVSYCQRDNKYFAGIKKDGKSKLIGAYATAKEAAMAYNKEAMKRHGKFALLNQV